MQALRIISLLALALVFNAAAQPKILTFIQTSTTQTNTVHVGDFESVKVLTARDYASSSFLYGFIEVSKSEGSLTNKILSNTGQAGAAAPLFPENLVIAGPADLTISSSILAGGNIQRTAAMPLVVTLEISPGAYSVTNSVTLGPGQGAEINLESSTNLIQWAPATNGVYTTLPAMFFRLHLLRIQ
jgi:hypothetical protein